MKDEIRRLSPLPAGPGARAPRSMALARSSAAVAVAMVVAVATACHSASSSTPAVGDAGADDGDAARHAAKDKTLEGASCLVEDLPAPLDTCELPGMYTIVEETCGGYESCEAPSTTPYTWSGTLTVSVQGSVTSVQISNPSPPVGDGQFRDIGGNILRCHLTDPCTCTNFDPSGQQTFQGTLRFTRSGFVASYGATAGSETTCRQKHLITGQRQ